MKTFIVLACLVAFAAADCNLLNRLKVKKQWSEAFGVSEDREAMGIAIFRYIFSIKPDTPTKYFARVDGSHIHSPKFIAHMGRILSGFDMTLSLLTDEGPLTAQLAHLEHQHHEMKIPNEYFDVFGHGLQLAVHSILGRCYDEEAWDSCTQVIEDGIKGH